MKEFFSFLKMYVHFLYLLQNLHKLVEIEFFFGYV